MYLIQMQITFRRQRMNEIRFREYTTFYVSMKRLQGLDLGAEFRLHSHAITALIIIYWM